MTAQDPAQNSEQNPDTPETNGLPKTGSANGAAKAPAEPKAERKPVTVTTTDIELEQLKKDASEHKDKYLRLLAEQENTRKRLQKEREKLTEYAVQNIIVDFLHPIDHLENALKFMDQMSDEVKLWGQGFRMILDQFKEVLSTNGVVPIVSVGKPFDPHLHEAIETVETTEYAPGTVVEENTRGYRMGDRTIRPARVKVAKAPGAKSATAQLDQEQEK